MAKFERSKTFPKDLGNLSLLAESSVFKNTLNLFD